MYDRQGLFAGWMVLIATCSVWAVTATFSTNLPTSFRERAGDLVVVPYEHGVLRVQFVTAVRSGELDDLVVPSPIGADWRAFASVDTTPATYTIVHGKYPASTRTSLGSVGVEIERATMTIHHFWSVTSARSVTIQPAAPRNGRGASRGGTLAGSATFPQARKLFGSAKEWNHVALAAGVHEFSGAPFILAQGDRASVGLVILNAAAHATIRVKGVGTGNDPLSVDWEFLEGGDFDVIVLPGPQPSDVLRQLHFVTGLPPLPPVAAFGFHLSGRQQSLAGRRQKALPSWFPVQGAPVATIHNLAEAAGAVIPPLVSLPVPYESRLDPSRGQYLLDDRRAPIHMPDVANALGRRVIGEAIRETAPSFEGSNVILVSESVSTEPNDPDRVVGKAPTLNGVDRLPPPVGDPTERGAKPGEAIRALPTESAGDQPRQEQTILHTSPTGYRMPRATVRRALGHFAAVAVAQGLRVVQAPPLASSSFSSSRRAQPSPPDKPFDGTVPRRLLMTGDFMTGTQRVAAAAVRLRAASFVADEQRRAAAWGSLANMTTALTTLALSGHFFLSVAIDAATVCPSVGGEQPGEHSGFATLAPLVRLVQHIALHPIAVLPDCPYFRTAAFAKRDPDDPLASVLRKSMAFRLQLVPYLYTTSFQSHLLGDPFVRPLSFEFDHEPYWVTRHQSFMLGSALLVRPITEADPIKALVASPTHYERWFSYWSGNELSPDVVESMQDAAIDDMLVLVRGGHVVPVAATIDGVRSAESVHAGAFSLVVALDGLLRADGAFFLDDGETHGYLRGAYCFYRLGFQDGVLYLENVHPAANVTSFTPSRILESDAAGSLQRDAALASLPLPFVTAAGNEVPRFAGRSLSSVTVLGFDRAASKLVNGAVLERLSSLTEPGLRWTAIPRHPQRGKIRVVRGEGVLTISNIGLEELRGESWRLRLTFDKRGE